MIYDTLKKTGLPCAYSHFKKNGPKAPPFIVYLGSGQDNMKADDTLYWRENTYQVEYYYTEKNEEQENAIEEVLLSDGYLFEKSEDTYLDDEDVFLIYYYVTKGEEKNG